MDVIAVPVGQLKHYPDNPRRHNMEALRASLRAHGQIRPLVVQRGSDVVLAGNGTLDAAMEEGMPEVDVLYVDADDEQAKAIVLIDNRTSDLATYDSAALASMLQSVADLTATGYTMDDVDDLVALLGSAVPVPDATMPQADYVPNEVRDPPRPPLTASGLTEVRIVLRLDERTYYDARTAELAEHWHTDTQAATVLEALRRAEAGDGSQAS